MRRFARLALLLLVAPGAAPRAAITMPPTVPVGGLAWFDTGGTISDVPPVVVCVRGSGAADPVVRADGTFLGFTLSQPGVYLFAVVAEGTPPGAESASRAAAFAQVSAGPEAPTTPTVPTGPGKPPLGPLAAGAQAYIRGVPGDFDRAAADVESRKVRTVSELVQAVPRYRQAGGQALAAEMDRQFKTLADAAGNITDPAAVAASLRAIGAAQKEVLKP